MESGESRVARKRATIPSITLTRCLSAVQLLCLLLSSSVSSFGPCRQASQRRSQHKFTTLQQQQHVSAVPRLVSLSEPRLLNFVSRRNVNDPWARQRSVFDRDDPNIVVQRLVDSTQAKPVISRKMVLSALFCLGVIYFLAHGCDGTCDGSKQVLLSAPDEPLVDQLGGLADSIFDATVPQTASDWVSVSVGEGVAGITGGLISASLSTAMRQHLRAPFSSRSEVSLKEQGETMTLMAASEETVSSEVLASGDYFFTRSAALPLLEATGLPPGVANIASVVLASVPYELVKLLRRRRDFKLEADRRLQELLEEQSAREKQRKESLFTLLTMPKVTASAKSVDLETLKPVQNEMKIDFVEIFFDITKWLGYAVLTTNFGGALAFSGLTTFPYTESFIFGALASMSAQVYADILYAFSGFGGDEKQREVLSRSLSDWSSLYLSNCISGATLFGVYEASQIPAKVLTSAFFSGGVEGCVGSSDFNRCVESFLYVNPPPGPTFEAQARAFITAFVSIWGHLGLDDSVFSTMLS